MGESLESPLLLESEIDSLKNVVDSDHSNMCEALKKLLATHEWVSKEHICQVLQSILLRLCSRYLYVEKRRGYALNPVGKRYFCILGQREIIMHCHAYTRGDNYAYLEIYFCICPLSLMINHNNFIQMSSIIFMLFILVLDCSSFLKRHLFH